MHRFQRASSHIQSLTTCCWTLFVSRHWFGLLTIFLTRVGQDEDEGLTKEEKKKREEESKAKKKEEAAEAKKKEKEEKEARAKADKVNSTAWISGSQIEKRHRTLILVEADQ